MSDVVALIYNADGKLAIQVFPDFVSQLDDPAFNPVGCVQVRVSKLDYDATKKPNSKQTLNDLAKPLVQAKDPDIAAKMTSLG